MASPDGSPIMCAPIQQRVPSTSSAYSLAASLVVPAAPVLSASTKGKGGFLAKLKNVRLGSSKNRRSMEWKCKGEDMENFDWPVPDWHDEPEPELEPSSLDGRQNARISSTSTMSTASVRTWPDQPYTYPQRKEEQQYLPLESPPLAQSQRQKDEQAAIEALETFFASRSVSHTYATASLKKEDSDLGIDIGAYQRSDDEHRPGTYLEAPPTPVIARKPEPIARESFLSTTSSAESEVPADPAMQSLRSSRGRKLPLKVDTSRASVQLASSTSSAPANFSRPLPKLPSPQRPKERKRPTSAIVIAREGGHARHQVDMLAMSAYSPRDLRELKKERRQSAQSWI